MKISIIVPVYNVEQYIIECLDSVLQQNDDDLELIIIDDGSTDQSLELCKTRMFTEKNNVIKIFSQKNQGLSSARNRGISIASGEYIMFLDSDDMLAPNALQGLRDYIGNNSDVDIFYFDAQIKNDLKDEKKRLVYDRKLKVKSEKISGKEYFLKYFLDPLIISSCMCIYKMDFIKKNALNFPEGKLHEDNMFSFQSVMMADNVIYIPQDYYIRRYREHSITTMTVTEKHVVDLVSIYRDNIEFAQRIKNDRFLHMAATTFIYRGLCYIFSKMKLVKIDETRVRELLNSFTAFLLQISPHDYTLTHIKAIEQLIDIIQEYHWSQTDKLTVLLDENITQSLYDELYGRLPFSSKKIVGIYGTGVHTENMLRWYSERGGKWNAKLYFLDSMEDSFRRKYRKCDILNIKDAYKYVDCIVISSFVHHAEMKLICEKIISNHPNIEIIDLYENEKLSIF